MVTSSHSLHYCWQHHLLPWEAIATHVGYPVMCPNAVFIIYHWLQIEGKGNGYLLSAYLASGPQHTLSHLDFTIKGQSRDFYSCFNYKGIKV